MTDAENKTKNGLTEIVCILDKSGSMYGLEADTIGGFNSFIKKQKDIEGKCFVSAVLFNNCSEVIYDRVELDKIEPMTEQQYSTGGNTALLDAIGNAIHHIGNVHKYARKEDVPEHTIFVIITDGMENSSCQYTYTSIKSKIERQKEKYGWEFLFLGANIDAIEEADKIGITKERAVKYRCDSYGTEVNFESVSEAACKVRLGKVLPVNWKNKIELYETKNQKQR